MRMCRRMCGMGGGYYTEPTEITPTRWRRYGDGVDNDDHFHRQNDALWIYVTLEKKAHEITIELHCNSISQTTNYYRQQYEKIAIFKEGKTFDPLSDPSGEQKHSKDGVMLELKYGSKSASSDTVVFSADSEGNGFKPGNYIFYIWRYIDNGATNHYTGAITATITAE